VKSARFHSKNFGKINNFYICCRTAASFDAGENLTCDVAAEQLKFGSQFVLRPTSLMAEFDDVFSDHIEVMLHGDGQRRFPRAKLIVKPSQSGSQPAPTAMRKMKPTVGNIAAPVEVFSTPGTGRISQSHANCSSVFMSAVMGCTLSTKPSSSKRKAM
jgi:hypothetical protein